MLILLEFLFGQRDLAGRGLMGLFNKVVQQNHIAVIHREARARNAVTERCPDFPNRATHMVHARFADRPFVLNVRNVFAD